jgi:hypothetical protein
MSKDRLKAVSLLFWLSLVPAAADGSAMVITVRSRTTMSCATLRVAATTGGCART